MDNVAVVLAELEEERRRLWAELARVERVIAVIEDLAHPATQVQLAAVKPMVMLLPPEDPALLAPAPPPSPPPVRAMPYAMLDVYEATAAYLTAVGVPKSSRQIADALVAGGFRTRSRYFCNVVGTMLRRSESTRPYRISVTADGKHWFVRKSRKSSKSKSAQSPS